MYNDCLVKICEKCLFSYNVCDVLSALPGNAPIAKIYFVRNALKISAVIAMGHYAKSAQSKNAVPVASSAVKSATYFV